MSAGPLCPWCRYQLAPRDPGRGRPPIYCTKKCAQEAWHHRRAQQNTPIANDIRDLLGLPERSSYTFTRPELEAMRRRLLRLVPAGGMSRYPASRRRAS